MPNFPSNLPFGYTTPSIAETAPANPTAPASTAAYKMQGLGGLITPNTPVGNILAIIQGTLTDAATTVGEGINYQLWYGPVNPGGAAPANAAAIPAGAVQLGSTQSWATGVTLTTAADSFIPFAIAGVVKGLTPGQQYWFDLAAESVIGASQVAIINPNVILVEIG